ncbi:MAG TPA: hypothetical protein VHD32_06050 [Candidatus Didemnitutus sp.]|nr:hypothetical protein [Candidatus Didemnitutus sp.]
MKSSLLLLFGFVAIFTMKARADYDVTSADRKFLSEVLAAIERKDADWIAAHTAFPIAVTTKAQPRIVTNEEEFSAIVLHRLTPELLGRFQVAEKEAPFKNWQGVMIGSGLLWCERIRPVGVPSWEYRIFAFGDFAFQPKEPNQSEPAASGRGSP